MKDCIFCGAIVYNFFGESVCTLCRNEVTMKSIKAVKCANCPAVRSEKVLGTNIGQLWFCSRTCQRDYEEGEKINLLSDASTKTN